MKKLKSIIKTVRAYLFADDRKLKKRIFLGAFSSFAFVLSFMIYVPVETYLGNSLHFVYSLSEILLPVLLAGAGAFLMLFMLSLLLKGRAYNWYITLLSSLSFASVIQAMFMNGNVGLLDGTKVQWEHYATSAVLSLGVWIGIVLVFFAFLHFSKKIWKPALIYICAMACFIQSLSILITAFTSEIDHKSKIVATSEGEMELSDKHNVVILSIDSMDLRYTQEVMENSPEYFREFDGFTWYRNTIAHNSRTYPNLAVILTGEPCLYDKPYDEYMEEAWSDNKFLEDIKAAGYDSRIYLRSIYANPDTEYMREYTSNYIELERNVYSVALEKELLTLSLYCCAPVALKPFFEIDTDRINSALGTEGYSLATSKDSKFYQKLMQDGLSLDSYKGEKGTFTYYHFNGCHAPYAIDENCNEANSSDVTIKEVTRGTLTNVSEYLRQMKELGIYDSADIFITTDHGYTGNKTELERERTVTLFYKPAGAKGEIVINESPQQLSNIRPTVLKAMGIDYSSYGTPVDEVPEDADIKRYFYMSGASEDGSVREENLLTYEVSGDANDFSNWKLIDKRPIEFPFLKG